VLQQLVLFQQMHQQHLNELLRREVYEDHVMVRVMAPLVRAPQQELLLDDLRVNQ
jgi:hypothetical protein